MFDVKFIQNLLSGHIDDIEGLGRLRFNVPDLRLRSLDSRNQEFDVPFSRTNYHANAPFNRAMRAYNEFQVNHAPE